MPNGPNGPIPFIVVDQFGYLPDARKVAVLRSPRVGYDAKTSFTAGRQIALIDRATGKAAKEDTPSLWREGAVDTVSGDVVWWFDFTEITQPGRYYVQDLDSGLRSPDFSIADDVYRQALTHAVRALFYQRAGIEKSAVHAGAEWADRASHVGPGQDTEAKPWPPGSAAGPGEVKDLRGGWYDAGDYNKYTSWTANAIIVLLRAYVANPSAFTDDLNIPESGNGIPDLIDEIKWGLDWLIRMQNADGSVLCVQGLADGSPPSAARGASYYGPATTSATLAVAGAFAFASRALKSLNDDRLSAYAGELAERARRAWDWAETNPSVTYWNNDARQRGSVGLAHGQQELQPEERWKARITAAIHLNRLKEDPAIQRVIEAGYKAVVPDYGPTQWDVDAQEALLDYATSPGGAAEIRADILSRFVNGMTRNAGLGSNDPLAIDTYRAPLRDFTWGSTRSFAAQGRLFQLAASTTSRGLDKAIALQAAQGYAHYLHGVNPLGMAYISNMAVAGVSHSAAALFHAWFKQGTRWERAGRGRAGPPPGYVVGGPNPQFSLDACCMRAATVPGSACGNASAILKCQSDLRPPLQQPAAKSYLDFNDGWPKNSWQVSEPSLSYQASYIRLLAPMVR